MVLWDGLPEIIITESLRPSVDISTACIGSEVESSVRIDGVGESGHGGENFRRLPDPAECSPS